ncbi:MAG: tetratricopeptide repeat protein [Pyrinomonadaceae bacterium]
MNHLKRLVPTVILLLLVAVSPSLACLWPPGEHDRVTDTIDLSTKDADVYLSLLIRKGRNDERYWEDVLKVNSKIANLRKDRKIENRIAVALIHLGQTSKAIEILEKLERAKPGSYEVAANLGTAYELVGDNEKAYEWIAEGIKRNPKSHYGTEWLHLKILQAKQAIKADPAWIENNSVLGIDWKTVGEDLTKISVKDEAGTSRAATEVQTALEYQLHERTAFVKPADPVVASLLYDLGRIVKVSRSEEHGYLTLGAAALYGFARFDENDFPPPSVARDYTNYIVGSILGVLLAVTAFGMWYTRRQEIK